MKQFECKCSMANCLKDLSFNDHEITQIQEFINNKQYQQAICILRNKKCDYLEKVHDIQSNIDCIDYWIVQIEREKKNERI